MTAVLSLQVENKWPVILGDLLLSGPNNSGKDLKIPIAVNVRDIFPAGSKFVPINLEQKVVVIADNLVVGWSGNFLNAKEVLRDLYAESKATPLTLPTLDLFFKSLPHSIWEKDLGFIGFIKDQGGIARFGYHYESLVTAKFGKVGFLGSGSNDLEELVSQFSEMPIKPIAGQPNMLDLSVAFSLSISGVLLNTELATFSSLRNYYGGGYEIATLIEGKFQKLDGVVYSFWTARMSEEGVRISLVPLHSMSFGYTNDILVIRSGSFNENDESYSMQNSGFAVLPMTRMVSDNEIHSLKLPDLNQKWSCNYFLVTPVSGQRQIYCQIDYRPKTDSGILFHDDQNKTVIAVQKGFIESVADEIYHHFSS